MQQFDGAPDEILINEPPEKFRTVKNIQNEKTTDFRKITISSSHFCGLCGHLRASDRSVIKKDP